MTADFASAVGLFALLAVSATAYAVRYVARGRASHARVEKEGKSALVGKGAMEMFYWVVEPVAAICQKTGLPADAVTWLSLLTGLVAAVAFGAGRLGIGAALAALSAILDALDGLVARRLGTASDAGEVLDAVVDRYVDFATIAGLAVAFRDRLWACAMALAALHASFMVSYSTAKAEALHVTPPRGSMKRAERAVLLIFGAALSVVLASERPVLFALGVIALLGNVSAIVRFTAIRAAVRGHAKPPVGAEEARKKEAE